MYHCRDVLFLLSFSLFLLVALRIPNLWAEDLVRGDGLWHEVQLDLHNVLGRIKEPETAFPLRNRTIRSCVGEVGIQLERLLCDGDHQRPSTSETLLKST